MGKLYVDPYWFLCKKLSFSYQEHFEIMKKIKRRSKWYNAFRYRKSTVDGSIITSVSVECLIWFIEVEFKEGNSKDLKINFLERYIEVLEDYLKTYKDSLESRISN